MAKKRKTWTWSPGPQPRPPADTATKAQTEAKARKFVEEVLKPRDVEPPPKDAHFNYVTDIILRWHGSSLFFLQVYTCPGPNALSPTSGARLARRRPAGRGRFDLAFMRHTGQWVELYQGLTVEKCLETIRDDPWFQA